MIQIHVSLEARIRDLLVRGDHARSPQVLARPRCPWVRWVSTARPPRLTSNFLSVSTAVLIDPLHRSKAAAARLLKTLVRRMKTVAPHTIIMVRRYIIWIARFLRFWI